MLTRSSYVFHLPQDKKCAQLHDQKSNIHNIKFQTKKYERLNYSTFSNDGKQKFLKFIKKCQNTSQKRRSRGLLYVRKISVNENPRLNGYQSVKRLDFQSFWNDSLRNHDFKSFYKQYMANLPISHYHFLQETLNIDLRKEQALDAQTLQLRYRQFEIIAFLVSSQRPQMKDDFFQNLILPIFDGPFLGLIYSRSSANKYQSEKNLLKLKYSEKSSKIANLSICRSLDFRIQPSNHHAQIENQQIYNSVLYCGPMISINPYRCQQSNCINCKNLTFSNTSLCLCQ